MKKIVPDPPRRKPITTPFFTVQSDMYPPHALAHVSELLRGVIETIDDECPGQGVDGRYRVSQERVALISLASSR